MRGRAALRPAPCRDGNVRLKSGESKGRLDQWPTEKRHVGPLRSATAAFDRSSTCQEAMGAIRTAAWALNGYCCHRCSEMRRGVYQQHSR